MDAVVRRYLDGCLFLLSIACGALLTQLVVPTTTLAVNTVSILLVAGGFALVSGVATYVLFLRGAANDSPGGLLQ